MSNNTILATAPLTATGYHLKATGTALGQSLIWDNGTNVGIGNTNTSYTLDVSGTGRFTGALTGTTTFTLDGTKKVYLRSAQPAASGLLSGSALAAEGNFSIYSDSGVAAEILGMYYWNGSTYRSALQFANVSSGSSNLILMKDGGNVGIGTSSPNIASFSGTCLTLEAGGSTSTKSAGVELAWAGATRSLWGGYSGGVYIGTWSNENFEIRTNATERMRITSIASGGWFKAANDGVFINTNGNYHELTSNRANDNVVYLSNTSATPYGPYIWFVNAAPNNTTSYFLSMSDSVNTKAEIYSNGTFGSRTGTYGSIISDEKYKTEIQSANSQWEDIKKLRVVNFKYKEDVELEGDNALRQIGFIAQEVEKVSPNLVYTASKKDSDETWKSVKTSIIEIKAIKALQEAMARIETLESTIQNLQEQINILAK